MDLTDLIKNFVSKKENASIVVDLTKLSTEYYSGFINRKLYNFRKYNVNYSLTLHKIQNYLRKHEEFKKVDPREFSVELMKYLYEHRISPKSKE